MYIFWGYEDFVDIFFFFFWGGGGGVSSQNWASLRVISMHFRGGGLRSRYRIGIFFGVAKISNIYLGCLKFLIIFLGER